jgi:membrane fusion protein, multidrug efflux system
MRTTVLLSFCVLLGGCVQAAQDASSPSAPPEVTVVTVHHQPVPVTTVLPGRTSAYLVAQVRAQVSNIVLARESDVCVR